MMRGLYLKTMLIYFVILVIFVLTILVSQYIFILFVIGSLFIGRDTLHITLTKDEVSFRYLLFHFILMIITMGSLFFIVQYFI